MIAFKVKEKIFSSALDAEGNSKSFSDDDFYVSDDVAVVFDGATSLDRHRPVKVFSSDPEWILNTAIEVRNFEHKDILCSIAPRFKVSDDVGAIFIEVV